MAKTDEPAAASTAESEAAAREGEAEQVEEQMAEEESAAVKREAQAQRAAQLKSVPEGALAPTEKTTRSGETQFQRDRLIREAQPLLGYDSHVVVGALHGDSREYLTVDQAKSRIEEWLSTVVTVHPDDPDYQEEAA